MKKINLLVAGLLLFIHTVPSAAETSMVENVNKNLFASDLALTAYVNAYKLRHKLDICYISKSETRVALKEEISTNPYAAELYFTTDILCFGKEQLKRVIYIKGDYFSSSSMIATKIEQYIDN